MATSMKISIYPQIRQRVLSDLRAIVKDVSKFELQFDLLLFGSCAWGYAVFYSDIDLMVVTESELSIDEQIMFQSLENHYDFPVHFCFRTKDRLIESKERFECQVKASCYRIFSRNIL